jgi:hypothetical protein
MIRANIRVIKPALVRSSRLENEGRALGFTALLDKALE